MNTCSVPLQDISDALDTANNGIWNGTMYEKPKRDRSTGEYHTSEWTLEPVGGFITGRHWWAKSEKQDTAFWASTKKELIQFCNWYMSGMTERIHSMHFKALY